MADKTYEVVGNHPVHGHIPGSSFIAELDDWAEKLLVEAGHLRVVDNKTSKEKTSDEE